MYGIIYKITNRINGKVYIGQTTRGLHKRRLDHLKDLKKGKHHNNHLQRSYNDHGNVYDFALLETARTKKELDILEVKYISQYNSTNHKYGYNIVEGGCGVRHTEAMKKHKSELLKKNNPMKDPEIAKRCGETKIKNGSCKGKRNGSYRPDIYDTHYLTMLYWDLNLPTSFIADFFNVSPFTILTRLKSGGIPIKSKTLQNVKTPWRYNRYLKGLTYKNTKYTGNPTSKHKYVSFCRTHGLWETNIKYKGKRHSLGYFKTEREAFIKSLKFQFENHFQTVYL